MTEVKTRERRLLEELFNRVSMNDLPAMSAHVQELISMANSSQATAQELTDVILKDYSLTNKILQVANSAYYARGVPITSISRAVTVIGFTVVRQLAMAIALFDELIKTASLKDNLKKLMTRSFLSATQARLYCEKRNTELSADDAFLSSLLYNLGEIVILVYMPKHYLKVLELIGKGIPIQAAAKQVLNSLSFHQIGKEIGHYWNFADYIIDTMTTVQPKAKNSMDTTAQLKSLTIFTNYLTLAVCATGKFAALIQCFRPVLRLNLEKSLDLVEESVEITQDMSSSMREGLAKLEIHERLSKARKKIKN